MRTITESIENERGCGFRKGGCIYLVNSGKGRSCGRFPMELTVCPCCSEGVKVARGWTWVQMSLFDNAECDGNNNCSTCPMAVIDPNTRIGMLWVGEKFYATPEAFMREAGAMGISRRISQVPKDFVVGETWIALAHRKGMSKGIVDGVATFAPAVFQMFQPDRIEYVVKGDESEEELDRLEARGLSLVRVIPAPSQPELDLLD